ncbi:hypothetical protein [Legionella hackeliae]|uniref:Uncharacterized protein n=1 Tax=Legionella hackeliae TaxID=449 RepID=A0A0A8URX7_LEGHA|nr:hypothetical protein [Legionella hackeliae]KTD13198.1 hypothetical protein Lhac_1067 [Legionella hackeliae]CEK11488.1 conserved protein of unknown function [Legionella hackeliae]STX48257.1 Uncharacterised protein [Legionella hackeliae]
MEIGPNFMCTSGYHETPLEDIVIPNDAFKGATSTNFSMTAGAGTSLNITIMQIAFECGYRLFDRQKAFKSLK